MLDPHDLKTALVAIDRRTPFFTYQLDEVRDSHRELRGIIPDDAMLYYSLKSNPHPDVVRELGVLGCGAEVSSVAEMEIATSVLAADRCIVTGPGKTERLLRAALQLGVRRFSIESTTELDRLRAVCAAVGASAEYLLRINAPSPRTGGLRMTGRPSQYGIPMGEALVNPSLFEDTDGVRWRGLHFFPASNLNDEELVSSFEHSLRAASSIQRAHAKICTELDLGGGFRSAFGDDGRDPYPSGLRNRLETMVAEAFVDGERPEVLSFESGRRLSASCGTLVASVVDVKEAGDRIFAVADAGINHLGGFGALRRVLPSRVSATLCDSQGTQRDLSTGTDGAIRTTVVGPTGAPPDVMVGDLVGPRPRIDDLIVVPGVGAYALTASLIAFLGVPTPAEIVLRGSEVRSVSSLRVSRSTWNESVP